MSCQSSVSVNQHFCLIQFIPKHNCEHFYLPPPPLFTLYPILHPKPLQPPASSLRPPNNPYISLFIFSNPFFGVWEISLLRDDFLLNLFRVLLRNMTGQTVICCCHFYSSVRYISLPSYRLLLMGALVNF